MSNMQFDTGTVAVATVRGVPNVRVFSYECPGGDLQWDSSVPVKGAIPHLQEDVTDIRPLVVLDMDKHFDYDNAQVIRDIAKHNWSNGVLESIADQIEQQTKPPKPEEPMGLGAVVEDFRGHKFVRTHPGQFPNSSSDWENSGNWFTYGQIGAVRVLSEGVQS